MQYFNPRRCVFFSSTASSSQVLALATALVTLTAWAFRLSNPCQARRAIWLLLALTLILGNSIEWKKRRNMQFIKFGKLWKTYLRKFSWKTCDIQWYTNFWTSFLVRHVGTWFTTSFFCSSWLQRKGLSTNVNFFYQHDITHTHTFQWLYWYHIWINVHHHFHSASFCAKGVRGSHNRFSQYIPGI